MRKWRLANPTWESRNRKHASTYQARWRKRNRRRVNAHSSARWKRQVETKSNEFFAKRLRTRVYGAIRHNRKHGTLPELLGCSVPEFRSHIQHQFRPGMSWDNYGEWHVDHIKPCAKFDLSKPEEQRACFHYTNLQPLWESENRAKGAVVQ